MPPEQKKRRVSFSRRRTSSSSETDVPQSEFAAAAAAAAAAESSPGNAPLASPQKSPNKNNTVFLTPAPPTRSRSTAGSELRSAKKTLQDNEQQLARVSQRSSEMNDSASNFASAAQGFLELSQKKKK